MNAAVRYYSRSGNTAAVAKAIASKCGVWAVSCDQDNAAISEPVAGTLAVPSVSAEAADS